MDEIFLWKKTEIKQNFLSPAQTHRTGVWKVRVIWKQLATFQTQIVQAKHQLCVGAWDVSGDSDTWPGSCHHFILAFKVPSFPCEANSSVILAFFFLFYIHTCDTRKQQLTVCDGKYKWPFWKCASQDLLQVFIVTAAICDSSLPGCEFPGRHLSNSELSLTSSWRYSLSGVACEGMFFTKASLRMF